MAPRYRLSTPHQSAMNSAIAAVTRFTDGRNTLIGEIGIDGGDDIIRKLGVEHGYLPANVSVAVIS